MPADGLERASRYLSVVVTSRNDGHGGDPLVRLQAFINTFDAQCRRFGLDAELIVVEWNPPADRPRLHELVRRPATCAFDLRFIEVPEALHQSLPHPSVMPLFQMIGKNVGIRRARGRFVLCTNIDIIFSNELVAFLASRSLQPGVLYRVDRHDVESDYPVDGTLDEQQAYCSGRHLRLHRAFGTFPVDPLGRLVGANPDVFESPVAIREGWHVREGDRTMGFYRWAAEHASIAADVPSTSAGAAFALVLEVEPNPYDLGSWVELEVLEGTQVLARPRVSDRQRLLVPLRSAAGVHEIVLRTVGASPRRENSLPAFERRAGLHYRLRSARLVLQEPVAHLSSYEMRGWRPVHRDVQSREAPDGIVVRSAAAAQSYCLRYGPLSPARSGRVVFAVDSTILEGNVSLHIVDEGSDRWVEAEDYEMSARGRRQLFVTADLKSDRAYSLCVANRYRGGDGISTFVVHGISGSVPWTDLELRSDARGLLLKTRLAVARGVRRLGRLPEARPRPTPETPATHGGHSLTASATDPSAVSLTARIEQYAARHPLPALHRNAAGDFQLMARENWLAVHGYAEFTMYSMNIDGLLCDVAYHAGIREEDLAGSRCIYHLEHSVGSGWTPEGEGKLRQRLSESGADWLDASTVDLWSSYMDWLKRPMLFNGPDWGFGGAVLRETTLPAPVDHT